MRFTQTQQLQKEEHKQMGSVLCFTQSKYGKELIQINQLVNFKLVELTS